MFVEIQCKVQLSQWANLITTQMEEAIILVCRARCESLISTNEKAPNHNNNSKINNKSNKPNCLMWRDSPARRSLNRKWRIRIPSSVLALRHQIRLVRGWSHSGRPSSTKYRLSGQALKDTRCQLITIRRPSKINQRQF